MNSIYEKLEKSKALDIARQYKTRGYLVRSRHGSYGRPELIRGFSPDVVVQKGDETIIIEVKSKASLKNSEAALRELAHYAKDTPGVRFDIVIANPPRLAKQLAAALQKGKNGSRARGTERSKAAGAVG